MLRLLRLASVLLAAIPVTGPAHAQERNVVVFDARRADARERSYANMLAELKAKLEAFQARTGDPSILKCGAASGVG